MKSAGCGKILDEHLSTAEKIRRKYNVQEQDEEILSESQLEELRAMGYIN